MTQSKAPSVGRRSHAVVDEGRQHPPSPRFTVLSAHLVAAAAALSSGAPGARDRELDQAVEHLRRVEILLEDLAREDDVPSDTARRMRWWRDAVSGHLSATASLRLLDLNANAESVLRRAVDSLRDQLASISPGSRDQPAVDA